MTKIEMTNEEAIELIYDIQTDAVYNILHDEKEALEMAIKALKQQSCEAIEEIPKDYKYDTETEDFLVYRHKYTGHEIHIEKPVPRYKLEQQPCEDAISREEAIKEFQVYREYSSNMSNVDWVDRIETVLTYLPSVIPKPKIGHWITDIYMFGRDRHTCSNCGKGQEHITAFCSWCGADMQGEEE